MSTYADQRLGQTSLATITRDGIGVAASVISSASHAVYRARGSFTDLSIERDVVFGPLAEHKLDVWKQRDGGPLVLFLHGGGFQQLDKRSHWAFSERFARMGAVVMNADYRLAPQHRHPAAADDAQWAYEFARENAERFGADPSRVIVSGVSAGANLALGLALTHRVEAGVLFSGLLQVSDMPRLYRSRSSVPRPIRARMASIGVDYPPEGLGWDIPEIVDPRLDPLLQVERLGTRLAPMFVSTGSRDNVLEDSLRLCARLPSPHQLDVVPGGGHAFQAFIWQREVRAVWDRCARFLSEHGVLHGKSTVTNARSGPPQLSP